jgi:acyl-CoA hydrolase
MPSIHDTVTEMIQFVLPEHAGAPGQIHGGRMMHWIVTVGTMAASRVARGTVALGAMDDIDFLHPVRVGEIAILRAQVEYVGRTSLEVGVRVFAENPLTGDRSLTMSSHLVFVKVDERAAPQPVSQQVDPHGPEEEALVQAARERREQRLGRFARKAERMGEVQDDADGLRWRVETSRLVRPEEALFGNFMFAGSLLTDVDETAAIIALRYARGPAMTASMDALDFYSPIRVGEIVTFKAGLNHVGTSSLEIGVKVLAELPWTGEVRHTCTAFLTFVNLGLDWRPRPLPPFVPETPGERRRWDAAFIRREARLSRVKRLKASLQHEGR